MRQYSAADAGRLRALIFLASRHCRRPVSPDRMPANVAVRRVRVAPTAMSTVPETVDVRDATFESPQARAISGRWGSGVGRGHVFLIRSARCRWRNAVFTRFVVRPGDHRSLWALVAAVRLTIGFGLSIRHGQAGIQVFVVWPDKPFASTSVAPRIPTSVSLFRC